MAKKTSMNAGSNKTIDNQKIKCYKTRQSNFIELSASNYCKQRVLHYFHFLPLCYITYVRGNLRVFSRIRVHCKALLNGIGVDCFDPLQIVGKTKGKMAEDNHLNITRKARIALQSNALIFQTNL